MYVVRVALAVGEGQRVELDKCMAASTYLPSCNRGTFAITSVGVTATGGRLGFTDNINVCVMKHRCSC